MSCCTALAFSFCAACPCGKRSPTYPATVFRGLGAHLGNARSQNADGHLLGHVRDDGEDANDPNTRIYRTSARQTFHTDSADVVGLLCIRAAKSGGESLLVSAESIYHRMMPPSVRTCSPCCLTP